MKAGIDVDAVEVEEADGDDHQQRHAEEQQQHQHQRRDLEIRGDSSLGVHLHRAVTVHPPRRQPRDGSGDSRLDPLAREWRSTLTEPQDDDELVPACATM